MIRAKMLAPLAGALLFSVEMQAQAQNAPLPYVEYAAKFTCGTETTKEPDDVVSGVYASSINIHNPQAQLAVSFIKKLVIANREDTTIGRIRVLKDVLKPDQADRVDCIFIRRNLDIATSAYVEGFVVLEVPLAASPAGSAQLIQPVLDVVAKYTARPSNGQVSTQSVVQIEGKPIKN
ncbi:MAG TPA: hypothetical protein VGF34_19095 [Stellaceae bacterium]